MAITNQKKHALAVSAVEQAHAHKGVNMQQANEALFAMKHDLITDFPGVGLLPAVALYKVKAYTKKGIPKHGWNSESMFKLRGAAEAIKTDAVIFIVDIERGEILAQRLSVLMQEVNIRGEVFPQGITVKSQEVFFALEQFNGFGGIPYRVMSQIVQEANEESADSLFAVPQSPLLDVIRTAGAAGLGFSIQHTGGGGFVTNIHKGNVTTGGAFDLNQDEQLMQVLKQLYSDASGQNIYLTIAASRAKDFAEIYTGDALTEAVIMVGGASFSLQSRAHQYAKEHGHQIYVGKVTSAGKHQIKTNEGTIFVNSLTPIKDEKANK